MVHRNIQTLSIELFKVKNGLPNEILSNILEKRQIVNYNLRSQIDFFAPSVTTSHYGLGILKDILQPRYSILRIKKIKNLM